MEDDTIKLLRECNAGIKMGISSLEDVMKHIQDENLRQILAKSRDMHEKLGNDTHAYLTKFRDDGKEPSAMAKAMSWIKTSVKLNTEETDSAAAELITDGCNMGIKSLSRYLNQYQAADQKIRRLTGDIIEAEESLVKELREYL